MIRYEVVKIQDEREIPLFKDGRTYKFQRAAEEVLVNRTISHPDEILEIREVRTLDNEEIMKRLDKCEAIMKRLMVFPDDLSEVAGYLVDHVYNKNRST